MIERKPWFMLKDSAQVVLAAEPQSSAEPEDGAAPDPVQPIPPDSEPAQPSPADFLFFYFVANELIYKQIL